MPDIEERLAKIEERLDNMNRELGELTGEQHTSQVLIKWIILPLLMIVGTLVGVDLTVTP